MLRDRLICVSTIARFSRNCWLRRRWLSSLQPLKWLKDWKLQQRMTRRELNKIVPPVPRVCIKWHLPHEGKALVALCQSSLALVSVVVKLATSVKLSFNLKDAVCHGCGRTAGESVKVSQVLNANTLSQLKRSLFIISKRALRSRRVTLVRTAPCIRTWLYCHPT